LVVPQAGDGVRDAERVAVMRMLDAARDAANRWRRTLR
jgi:hypothetical protein